MKLTVEDEISFLHASKCENCGLPFTVSDAAVRDHSHLTGLYRAAIHRSCNILYQESTSIPVIGHNLSSYDLNIF